jgi:tetratricopeptide (TPR) repeat protein
MSEDFDDARQNIDQAESMYRELGARALLGELRINASWVERLAGNLEQELAFLNESEVTCEETGAESLLGYIRARRALALARLGRTGEAKRDLELADEDDAGRTKMVCEFARARLLLDSGDAEGALAASDRADAVTRERQKFVNLRVEALIEIATVTFGVGQLDRAIEAATAAEDLARQKGNLALQRRAREELARFSTTSQLLA